MNKKDYCTQNNGKCSTCSLSHYGMDCQNQPIKRGGWQGGGRPQKDTVVFYRRVPQGYVDILDCFLGGLNNQYGSAIDILGTTVVLPNSKTPALAEELAKKLQIHIDRGFGTCPKFMRGEMTEEELMSLSMDSPEWLWTSIKTVDEGLQILSTCGFKITYEPYGKSFGLINTPASLNFIDKIVNLYKYFG